MSQTEPLEPPAPLHGEHAARLLPVLGRREISTLGALAASGKIGSAELIAANRWCAVYMMAVHGVIDSKGGSSGGIKLFEQERRAKASTSYEQAREALGRSGDHRMRLLLGDGLSVAALGRALGHNAHVASGLVIGDLERLAEHYTGVDAKKKRRVIN